MDILDPSIEPYEQQTRKTLSTEYRLDDTSPRQVFDQLLNIIALANKSDITKRNVYYRKPIAELEDRELEANVNLQRLDAQVSSFLETIQPGVTLIPDLDLLHAIHGKMSELGEMVEMIVSKFISGEPIDVVNLAEEVGDDLFYTDILIRESGLTYDQIKVQNLGKLFKKRYKDGFNPDAAVNRNLDEERKELESHHTS